MIRKIALLLTLPLLLASCTKEQPGYDPPQTADRTLVVYLSGRSLLSYYRQNIRDIKAGLEECGQIDGRILVCWQPAATDKAELTEIYIDRNTRQAAEISLKTYDNFDAASANNVRQLLADAVATAPANRYGLTIGCHGKAWVPAYQGIMSSYGLRKAGEQWPAQLPGALPTRSFGDSGHELDIPDLAGVLSNLNVRFDYLLFDACFMANIETLYDLRKTVDYIVAAPCEIMAAGFPYRRALPRFFASGTTPQNLEKICWEFWNFYMNDWDKPPYNKDNNAQSGCISLAVTSELDALASVMRSIDQAGKQSYSRTLQSYEGMGTHLFYDLGDYVDAVCSDPGLLDEFTQIMERAFPAGSRLHTPKFYSTYNNRMNLVNVYWGVTVSEPSTKYRQDNLQTAWYRATHMQ